MRTTIFICFFFISNSCSDHKEFKSKKIKQNLDVEKIEYLDSADDMISVYQDFEAQHNIIFQEDLKKQISKYYSNKIDEYIDNETGGLNLLLQLKNRIYKSESERKLIFQLKLNQYFSTTSFRSFVRNEVWIYTSGVNNQRKNGISKILGQKHINSLDLPIIKANIFNIENSSLEKIVTRLNAEMNDQLADVFFSLTFEFILMPILLILFAGSLLIGEKGCVVSIIIAALSFVILLWRSEVRGAELQELLQTECSKVLLNQKVDYLPELNKNTILYYSNLRKIKEK